MSLLGNIACPPTMVVLSVRAKPGATAASPITAITAVASIFFISFRLSNLVFGSCMPTLCTGCTGVWMASSKKQPKNNGMPQVFQ